MQAHLTRQETIGEITRRLVEFYRPVRIYLFGSEARGESGADSDLDFLVVVPDDAPKDLLRGCAAYSLFVGIANSVHARLPAADQSWSEE